MSVALPGTKPRGGSAPPLARFVAKLPLLVAAALVLLTLAWSVRGAIVFARNGADMAHRWQDVQTMLRGIDPNTLAERVERARVPNDSPLPPSESPVFHPDLAFPDRPWAVGVYPPWSYVLAAPLHAPPRLDDARLLYFCVWVSAFGAVAVWIARRHAARGAVLATAATAAVLAHAGFSTDLAVGNYGLLCFALMVAMFAALERERPWLAGLILGVSALKPFVTLPFALALLVRPEHRAGLPIALAVPLLAAGVHWQLTGVDPLTSFVGSQSHNASFAASTGGLPTLVERLLGGYHRGAQYASSLAALAVGTVAMLRLGRDRPLSFRFALAALVSCVWTYHRNYDFVVIGFLTLACLQVLFEQLARGDARRRVGTTLCVVLALGASTWPPASALGGAAGTSWRLAVWAIALLWLVRAMPPTAPARDDADRRRRGAARPSGATSS